MTSRLLPPLFLGVVHGLVDAACAFVLYRDLALSPMTDLGFALWVSTYDVLAFVGQVPLGLLSDRLRARRRSALGGVALVAMGLVMAPGLPITAALVVGLGNALYHVGGGAYVLATSGERAGEIGLFVGPGAVGLAIGILGGHSGLPLRLPLLLGLAVGGWYVWRIIVGGAEASWPSRRRLSPLALLAVGLILVTVASRAFVGDALAAVARADSEGLVVGLAIAACVGKGVGGFVGDRLGWAATAALALGFAAPLLAVAPNVRMVILAAAFLVQTTMPLTVKAVHLAMPHRPGLAFGLASMVLLVGSVPGLAQVRLLPFGFAIVGLVLASAVTLVFGLRLLRRADLHRGVADDAPRASGSLEDQESLSAGGAAVRALGGPAGHDTRAMDGTGEGVA